MIYYIEALHKENSGGNNLAVGWTIPGTATIDVITGSYLLPFVPAARLATREARAEAPESLAISPNPFDDKLTVRFGKGQYGTVTVTITDVPGKVYHQRLVPVEGVTETTLDLAGKGLRPGLYLLKIRDAAGKGEVVKVVRK